MEATIIYLLKVSGCLLLFYIAYLVIFRNDTNFKGQRVFLLISLAISLGLPLNKVSLRKTIVNTPTSTLAVSPENQNFRESETSVEVLATGESKSVQISKPVYRSFDYKALVKVSYGLVFFLLIFRVLLGMIKLGTTLLKSEKIRLFNTTIYLSSEVSGSTNLFGYIFLNPSLRNDTELHKIILHEKIHASQYHSIDVLVIELLAAAMWFNPVVWLMRRSLQQLHEYLADEGVLRSGVNRLEYQTLLVNHIAEDRLVLSSGFNSSIKKRIFMMTKTSTNRNTKLKLMALLPIAFSLLISISWINAPLQQNRSASVTNDTVSKVTKKPLVKTNHSSPKVLPADKVKSSPVIVFTPADNDGALVKEPVIANQQQNGSVTPQEPPVAAVSLTKMNVLYLGVDNPVTIAVSNHSPSEVLASINNGTLVKIEGRDFNYNVRPKQRGMAILSIYIGDKLISKQEYRVKMVPDPVAKIAGKKGGAIDKSLLASQSMVEADMENFDFDLRFEVTGFSVTSTIKGFVLSEKSNSNKLTQAQLDLISKTESGQKVYIADITCAGPDGTARELSPIAFEIR